jgi:hypothetical protein
VNLKSVALQLCTCTWIEIMTGAGIAFYMLYLQNYMLAVVTVAAFAPLIGFHFAVDRIKPGNSGQKSRVVRLRSLSGRSWPESKDKLIYRDDPAAVAAL